jgi:hypothetical protein
MLDALQQQKSVWVRGTNRGDTLRIASFIDLSRPIHMAERAREGMPGLHGLLGKP